MTDRPLPPTPDRPTPPTPDSWLLPGATRDRQSVTADWRPTGLEPIDGVLIKEVLNVPRPNGYLTEVFRIDWDLGPTGVGQVFQGILEPGGLSAWHAHERTTDRLFVATGHARIVLYDPRPGSPTQGRLNEIFAGTPRPRLIVIPPKVWHGVQNLSGGPTNVLNLVDHAYDYENPDHFRLPVDTPAIPFRFPAV